MPRPSTCCTSKLILSGLPDAEFLPTGVGAGLRLQRQVEIVPSLRVQSSASAIMPGESM